MMSFLFDYGLFLAKALTVALCILLVVATAAAGKRRHGDDDDKMVITNSSASASMPNCSTRKR